MIIFASILRPSQDQWTLLRGKMRTCRNERRMRDGKRFWDCFQGNWGCYENIGCVLGLEEWRSLFAKHDGLLNIRSQVCWTNEAKVEQFLIFASFSIEQKTWVFKKIQFEVAGSNLNVQNFFKIFKLDVKTLRTLIWNKFIIDFFFRVVHQGSGRYLEVYSNQEGVQLYTTNFLPDPCGNVSCSSKFKRKISSRKS